MTGVRVMNVFSALLAGLAALIVLAAGVQWLAQRPAFDFRRIDVRGDLHHVTAASIRAAIGGRLRGNYFTMRLDDTRRLFEAVPWVARAGVRRVWPDRLLVELTEYRAIGVWNDGRLLSDSGQLFVANAAEAEIDGPLPAFSGPAALAAEVARQYVAFTRGLAGVALSIESIDVSDRHSWSLQVAGAGVPSTTLQLGRDDAVRPLQQRLDEIVAAYPMVVARVGGPPPLIDARYANGIAAAPPPARNR